MKYILRMPFVPKRLVQGLLQGNARTCCRFRCDQKAFFSSVDTTYEEDANRDAEVPVGVGGAGAVNMTLAEGRNAVNKVSFFQLKQEFILLVEIGGAGAKVVAVARASLVAGKEDRISALPSPQGLLGLLGLGLCLIPPELLMQGFWG